MSQPKFDAKNKCIVVTGGGSGIGAALCCAFARAGARRIVMVDLHTLGAKELARQIANTRTVLTPYKANVSQEDEIAGLVEFVEDKLKDPIDLFVANAGIYKNEIVNGTWICPSLEAWDTTMQVNLNQHLHVLKHVLPRFQSRKQGHFLFTASAAGLLIHPDSLSYTVSKAAVVSLAEWTATCVANSTTNIGVSVLCPQAVDTPMMKQAKEDGIDPKHHLATSDGILKASDVANTVLEHLLEGKFLILPHTVVKQYNQFKASNTDKWISATRYLVSKSRTAQSKL